MHNNMKKIKALLLLTAAVITITVQSGCNGLSKMEKNAGNVKYEVTPNPLELHGDSVAINIKATYPPKYFAKKVSLTITPSIHTSAGDKDFKPVDVIGEKLEANGTKINSKTGGSITYTDKIAYTPEMRAADVVVKIHGAKGNKTKDFAPMAKIADATITTPLLVKHDEKVIYEKDAFQRITPVSFNGKLYYPINVGTVSTGFNQKKAGVSNKTESSAVDSIVNGS